MLVGGAEDAGVAARVEEVEDEAEAEILGEVVSRRGGYRYDSGVLVAASALVSRVVGVWSVFIETRLIAGLGVDAGVCVETADFGGGGGSGVGLGVCLVESVVGDSGRGLCANAD